MTPLETAAENGDVAVCELLLRMGADIEAVQSVSSTLGTRGGGEALTSG